LGKSPHPRLLNASGIKVFWFFFQKRTSSFSPEAPIDQTIKSRPLYKPLRLDPAGRAHLAATDHPVFPDAACEAPLQGAEFWVVAEGIGGFPSAPALLAALTERMAAERTGFRLYAAGTEGFLWDVANAARDAGLAEGEFFLAHAGSLCRRVYCTHCKAMIENVSTNLVCCSGCGAMLFVRDHFSRRLAAFMGVQVDAEQPGMLPPVATLYP
jgi:hypothetical protein